VISSIALLQLKKIDQFNLRRKEILNFYKNNLKQNININTLSPLLRLPLLVKNRDNFKKIMRRNGVYLGDWYSNIVDPKDTDLKQVMYKMGSCPNAERIAGKIINLPTYPNLSNNDLKKVVKLFNKYAESN